MLKGAYSKGSGERGCGVRTSFLASESSTSRVLRESLSWTSLPENLIESSSSSPLVFKGNSSFDSSSLTPKATFVFSSRAEQHYPIKIFYCFISISAHGVLGFWVPPYKITS